VGGLPKERTYPYQYKAGFSPSDVLEEYTRPARYILNGEIVTKPALSESELLYFKNIGTLEAFNTDGLRTLLGLKSVIPNLIEKTLRYPGHIELMKVLRETGFFSKDTIDIKKTSFRSISVRPLDVTSKLLFPLWEMRKDEIDLTVMRFIVVGEKVRRTFDLVDYAQNGFSSMARTTGYTCTGAVKALVAGEICKKPGVYPTEQLEDTKIIFEHLKERNIVFSEKTELIAG